MPVSKASPHTSPTGGSARQVVVHSAGAGVGSAASIGADSELDTARRGQASVLAGSLVRWTAAFQGPPLADRQSNRANGVITQQPPGSSRAENARWFLISAPATPPRRRLILAPAGNFHPPGVSPADHNWRSVDAQSRIAGRHQAFRRSPGVQLAEVTRRGAGSARPVRPAR